MARRRRGQFPEPKRVNGRWKIWYRTDDARQDGSRSRVQRTKCLGRADSMTLTQARKEAARFLQAINDVEEGIEHSGKTMVQLIGNWREAVGPTLKLSSRMSYEWAIKRVEAAVGKAPLSAIGKADIQAFLTAAGRELSGESVRDLRARLSGFFSVAEEWGWVRLNPVHGKLRLPPRDPVRKKVILSPAQFRALVVKLREPYSTLVVLAVLAGLRRGELAALRWGDNDRSGTLVIDEAVYGGELGSPKTQKSKREVSIGTMAQKAIDDWRAKARFTGRDDFMFAVRTNTPIDLHNAVARNIKPAARKLGIGPVSWHDLRHTYTTWGRSAGIKAETLRDQLGHSSVMTTLDIYSHAQDRTADAAKIEQYAACSERVM